MTKPRPAPPELVGRRSLLAFAVVVLAALVGVWRLRSPPLAAEPLGAKCARWKERGECSRASAFMLVACEGTCARDEHLCARPAPQDTDAGRCQPLAAKGRCSDPRQPSSFFSYCFATCAREDPDTLIARILAEAGHPPAGGFGAGSFAFPPSPLRQSAPNGSSYTWAPPSSGDRDVRDQLARDGAGDFRRRGCCELHAVSQP